MAPKNGEKPSDEIELAEWCKATEIRKNVSGFSISKLLCRYFGHKILYRYFCRRCGENVLSSKRR